MKIVAHRGYWKQDCDKNTPEAFIKAWSLGYGIEVDIRDHHGVLVIEHDLPKGEHLYTLDALLSDLSQIENKDSQHRILALNIKSDGLFEVLKEMHAKIKIPWFCFDMSIPDTRAYIKHQLPFYARYSEYESGAFQEQAGGAIVDAFDSDAWYQGKWLAKMIHDAPDQPIMVMSPELHARPHQSTWDYLRHLPHESLQLCTDFPDEADDFFN